MDKKGIGIKLTQKQALSRILSKCQERDISFIGFDNKENKYTNNIVYLILKCNKCGHVWKTTNYTHFIDNIRNCPNCSSYKHLTDQERINSITKTCEERDFKFMGYVGDTFKGGTTKLKLKCTKCNKEWDSTTLSNFLRNDRKSHHCGRNNSTPIKKTILNTDRAAQKVIRVLKGTSLEFIGFDGGYNGFAHSYVFTKCTKCGKTNRFSFHYLVSNKKKVWCKNCEIGGKFSNEEAVRIIQDKAQYLDYVFLGWDNKENVYKGKETYLILQCKKCGRVWKTTTFESFKLNTIKCIGCTNSWKMPKEIEYILKKENINFIEECRSKNLPWLKNKVSLSLDFYLPEYKIGIECQGRQHFEPVLDFGGERTFVECQLRDKKKLELCKENDIILLYYDSEHNHQSFLGEKVYNSQDEILREIRNLINHNNGEEN